MAVLPPDPVFCLKSEMGHVHSLCFPENKNKNYTSQLLASNEDGYVYFWSLETNRLRYKQQMGESIQAIHSFDRNLVTQEKSGTVKLWTLENQSNYELLKLYQCAGGYCKSVLLDDNLLLPQDNGTVDSLNVNTLDLVRHFEPDGDRLGHLMALQSVKMDGKTYLLGGYETGDVILWDYNTGKACGQLKLREYITSLTYDPVSMRGVCGNASNVLQVFTVDRQFNIKLKCELTTNGGDGCNVVKLRPDRKVLAAGGWDGRLRVFSWKSLRLLVVLTEHKGSLTDVQFSPKTVRYWDSPIMAAGGSDGVVSLWSLYN